MAEDVNEPAAKRESRRDRARGTAYRFRFAAIYVFLAAIVGAGVGAFVVLATRPAPADESAWSTWRPEGSNERSAKQIADHVSKRYRLPSGNQLAIALVGPPEVQDVSVRAIAVYPDTSRGQAEEDDVEVVDTRNSIMYLLCGLGKNCSIAEGRPSQERHQLLRREALELSLYSFKYLDGIESVVVFLPPRPDNKAASSVFLKKSEVREELEQPLSRTLLRADPPELGEIDTIELGNIERLTAPRIFQYQFQQAQEGSAILVLSPIVG